MAFVFYRHPRRPNEVSATIAGSVWAITAAVERLEREGNEVTGIMPPLTKPHPSRKGPTEAGSS
jgi:hypothetical protein